MSTCFELLGVVLLFLFPFFLDERLIISISSMNLVVFFAVADLRVDESTVLSLTDSDVSGDVDIVTVVADGASTGQIGLTC